MDTKENRLINTEENGILLLFPYINRNQCINIGLENYKSDIGRTDNDSIILDSA